MRCPVRFWLGVGGSWLGGDELVEVKVLGQKGNGFRCMANWVGQGIKALAC